MTLTDKQAAERDAGLRDTEAFRIEAMGLTGQGSKMERPTQNERSTRDERSKLDHPDMDYGPAYDADIRVQKAIVHDDATQLAFETGVSAGIDLERKMAYALRVLERRRKVQLACDMAEILLPIAILALLVSRR